MRYRLLHEIRKEKGIGLRDFAKKCGIAVGTYSHIERGISIPTSDQTILIENQLGEAFSQPEEVEYFSGPVIGCNDEGCHAMWFDEKEHLDAIAEDLHQDSNELHELFVGSYLSELKTNQANRIKSLQFAAKEFAQIICKSCLPSRERDQALEYAEIALSRSIKSVRMEQSRKTARTI